MMTPPLIEASHAKVTSCALVASTDLEKALGAAKEVIRGAGAPSKMTGGQPTTIGGRLTPLEVGQPSPTCQSSPAAQGRGSCPVRALFPHPTIVKEHRSVMTTHPSTGVLTTKKITIRHQLVVPSSSSDDDLPLVRHDARVDPNPSSARIRYTQEVTLVSDSHPPSLPPYIVWVQRVGVRYDKVLIPNPAYKGKGRAESASSNPTPRVQRCRPPPKIRGPPGTMEFSDADMEELVRIDGPRGEG
jgi:hypothetical protein